MKALRLLRAGLWVVAILGAFGNAHVAYAADVKLMSPSVMKPVLGELGSEFQRTTGHRLDITYDAAGALKRRIENGESSDALILQKPVIEAFSKDGRLAVDTIVPLARSGLAAAVRKGAPKPDISSVEAFKAALLAARSLGYFDPALGHDGGIHFRGVVERLGIAPAVNARAKLFKVAADFEAEREAALVIAQPTDVLATQDYEVVGWIPEELQDRERFTWAMGVMTAASDPKAARALIDFLASPTAASVIKRCGMDPPPR